MRRFSRPVPLFLGFMSKQSLTGLSHRQCVTPRARTGPRFLARTVGAPGASHPRRAVEKVR